MIAEASKMLIQIFTTTTSWKAPVTGKAIVIALGGGGGGGCGAASGSTSGYGPAGGGGGSGRINIGDGIPIHRYNNQLPIYKGSGGNGARGATTTFIAGNNGEDGLVAICYWEE